jgi:hypothetical protein
VSKGESNERCMGGGDGDDPTFFNMEKTHIVGQTMMKMNNSNKSYQNLEV